MGLAYSFKEAINLALYKVQEQQSANRETQRKENKFNSSFIMGKKDGSETFSFFAKTEAMKAKWIEAIKLAQENASPPQGINYVMHTFDQPTECSVCRKLLRGVFFQGYKCRDPGSKIAVHKECIGKQPTGYRGQVRALCNYTGNPNPRGGRPALPFQKDDVIILLNNDAQWWKVSKYSMFKNYTS
uniref:Guanine nucleotide exchange factor VAV2 n=1 Tax=Magallana gigas TaxID=29159 RepID=A0A8W8L7W7_MAGGI